MESDERLDSINKDNSSIGLARNIYQKQMFILSFVRFAPFLVIAIVYSLFHRYYPEWQNDPFIFIIVALFGLGQLIACMQFFKLHKESRKNILVLHTASEMEKYDNVNPMWDRLKLLKINNLPLKDLIEKWFKLSARGEQKDGLDCITTLSTRYTIKSEQILTPHVTIGRTILKLGFLGTLIGLIMSFPPMKNAILGLSGSEGKMTFIRDIAHAIEGDQYAILTTLIATGLSILVETITTRVLGMILSYSDVALSHLADWYIIFLKPIIKKESSKTHLHEEILKSHEIIQSQIIQMQQEIDNNISAILKSIKTTEHQIADITTFQQHINERVAELAAFEIQYQNFMKVKEQSSLPYLFKPTKPEEK